MCDDEGGPWIRTGDLRRVTMNRRRISQPPIAKGLPALALTISALMSCSASTCFRHSRSSICELPTCLALSADTDRAMADHNQMAAQHAFESPLTP